MLSKKLYLLLSIVGALICAAVFAASFPKLDTYGQNSAVPVATPAETPIVESEKTPAETVVNKITMPSAATPLSALAVTENVRLRDNLDWSFGGKQQRGWYLYAHLIRQTVGSEARETTDDFARRVAEWQRKNGLHETGTVDRETLYKLIEFWQSRRVRSSVYPAESDLLTAPIADFYDPSRAAELLKVERETYRAYKKMLAAAAKDLKLKVDRNGELADEEKFLRIVSAFRSREYQAKLRAASPQSGRAGLAVNSPHFTGRALDIYVGGEPTITKDANRAVQVNTPAYQWLVKNAARFGFYPYFYEPWHWEYVPPNTIESKNKINDSP